MVYRIRVSKVLRTLPIHSRIAIEHLEANVCNIASSVLAYEIVIVIKMVLNFARWYSTIIGSVVGHLHPASTHIDDEAVLVARPNIPRILVVYVRAEVRMVMCHIPTHDTKWSMFWTHVTVRSALSQRVQVSRSEESMLVANHMIIYEVVCHTDGVNCHTLTGSIRPSHSTIRTHGPSLTNIIIPIRTNNRIITDSVVHLVTILDIDTYTSAHPEHICVHYRPVRTMHCNGRLERIHNSIALEHTLGTLAEEVPMQTVSPNNALLTTKFDARVANDTDTSCARLVGHVHREKPLTMASKSLVVASDENRPLHVDNFCSNLKALAFNHSHTSSALEPMRVVYSDCIGSNCNNSVLA
jgi:hypothetical protein